MCVVRVDLLLHLRQMQKRSKSGARISWLGNNLPSSKISELRENRLRNQRSERKSDPSTFSYSICTSCRNIQDLFDKLNLCKEKYRNLIPIRFQQLCLRLLNQVLANVSCTSGLKICTIPTWASTVFRPLPHLGLINMYVFLTQTSSMLTLFTSPVVKLKIETLTQ